MEVETPMMCSASVTDPYVESVPVCYKPHSLAREAHYYLQTSPEYCMKRLLAAGSGPIYQMAKAFRQGESGRFHNPEFTLLEWYRLDFDHHALMDEVDEFLQQMLKTAPAERHSYEAVFLSILEASPHHATLDELKACAKKNAVPFVGEMRDVDGWLHLLFAHCIGPQLGKKKPCFIYDFPASQSALARTRKGAPVLASRFEVYYQGIELANGFHELADVLEQRRRFGRDLAKRKEHGLPLHAVDEKLLSALSHGLPDCAGVALGIDRLVMLATHAEHISQVLSFDVERA